MYVQPISNRLGNTTPSSNMTTQVYSVNVTRAKNSEASDQLDRLFVSDITNALSGSDTLTRNLDTSLHEWDFNYQAQYPMLLRMSALANPQLLTENQTFQMIFNR